MNDSGPGIEDCGGLPGQLQFEVEFNHDIDDTPRGPLVGRKQAVKSLAPAAEFQSPNRQVEDAHCGRFAAGQAGPAR